VNTDLATVLATENERLRRDIVGHRQALRAKDDVIDALRRQVDRLDRIVRLLALETERHGLAVSRAINEFEQEPQ